MKITIDLVPDKTDTEITVSCGSLTPEIEKLLATLRILDRQLTVRRDDSIHLLDLGKVIYIEAVERSTFVYTAEAVYESDFRLYELEQQLADSGFFRVSKSCLVCLKKIHSLKADIDRKIRITMENGEQIVASRMYADELRKRLGVK
ncbi:MAG: LytTR family transcriptional regulator [Ruminococcaceae bacterium]|nr:LytTR family transcriptional regulator [Oscillospiraceae bacterium]